jgi:hypothetical protein
MRDPRKDTDAADRCSTSCWNLAGGDALGLRTDPPSREDQLQPERLDIRSPRGKGQRDSPEIDEDSTLFDVVVVNHRFDGRAPTPTRSFVPANQRHVDRGDFS